MSVKIDTPFWTSVLQSIKSILSSIQPISVENIKGIPLWFNDNLNIIMNVAWLQEGIYLVGDVLDDDMLQIPKEDLEHMLHLNISFLSYETFQL